MTGPHPLDPLTADEIRRVTALLRRERGVARPQWRIAAIELREPAKEVAGAPPGDLVERLARAIVWDTSDGLAYVAVLSAEITGPESSGPELSGSDDTLLAWEPQPGRQPNATVDEWHECDEAMRRHPDVIAALAERGIDDPSLTLIDVWTYGATLIPEPFAGRRIGWCDVRLRGAPGGNPYAHPGHGLKLVVDMNTMELLEIQDGPIPASGGDGGVHPGARPGLRRAHHLQPLQVVQPEGASFTLDGHALSWENWRMRLGFTYREGLVLHEVGWADGSSVRPIGHRLSFAEMVVPYRDPTPDHLNRPHSTSASGSGLHDHLAGPGLRLPGRDHLCGRRAARLRGRADGDPQRDLPARGGRRRGVEARRRPGRGRGAVAAAGWSCRSTPPSRTTSTSCTGGSTKTARSSARSGPPGSWSPPRSRRGAEPRRTGRSSTRARTRPSTSTSSSPASTWTSTASTPWS